MPLDGRRANRCPIYGTVEVAPDRPRQVGGVAGRGEQSIHAIAIANLGEVATGLAMLVALPTTVRGIVLGLEVEYLKKARGRLVAECRVVVPEIVAERTELPVAADIRDQAGDIVARVRARWLLGPVSGGRRAGE